MDTYKLTLSAVLWLMIISACVFPRHSHAAKIGESGTAPAAQSQASTSAASAPAPDVSRLAADFAEATALACAPASQTDTTPIDPPACSCNTFLAAALPSLTQAGNIVTGKPIADAERLRIMRIRLQTGDGKLKFQMACGALHMQLRDDALTAVMFIGLLPK